MAKVKISIYLIKDGVDIDSVVNTEKTDVVIHRCDDGSVVYTKLSNIHTPQWVNYFDPQLDLSELKSSSSSVLHVIRVEVEPGIARLFAISFGFGYTLLNCNVVEERFGLKVALNQSTEGRLRKLKRTSVSGNSRKTDEQMPVPSSVDAFGIDIERDLVDGVTVSGGEDLLATGSITGSDSLALSAPVSIENIPAFLQRAFSIYQFDDYKRGFSWIDRVAPVKNPSIIDDLNAKAVDLINQRNPAVYMAVPDVLEWEAIRGFKVGRSSKLVDDICISHVLDSLGGEVDKFETLRKFRISVIGQEGDSAIMTWSAAQCLYGEIDYDGRDYCANNGKWFQIDTEYKHVIENRYQSVPLYRYGLIDYRKGETEGPYNARLAEDDPSSRILMDRETIYHGDYGSQVELCDVLVVDGAFIHVKHYGGSSSLSHLFAQGLVSAQLIKSDDAFRRKAQDKIDSVKPNCFTLKRDSIKEVVYAIITKHGDSRPRIPFFSMVSLDVARRRLESMDVNVSLAMIKEPK